MRPPREIRPLNAKNGAPNPAQPAPVGQPKEGAGAGVAKWAAGLNTFMNKMPGYAFLQTEQVRIPH